MLARFSSLHRSALSRGPSVELVSWNPRRPRFSGRMATLAPRRAVNNFGDLMGPILVRRILQDLGLRDEGLSRSDRLLSVGSILHLAEPNDTVWGTGINGKIPVRLVPAPLDIRAVRGPLTRERLQRRGHEVPEVFGDPALLWTDYWPREHYLRGSSPRGVGIVPNLHDWPEFAKDPRSINPRQSPHRVIGAIARCEFVVGSSLHGVVMADAMGIPARFMRSSTEPPFKYRDYLFGTGRSSFRPANTVRGAVRMGGQPSPVWDAAPLRRAFPVDLWTRSDSAPMSQQVADARAAGDP